MSPRTRVKICGVTRAEDARAAAQAGADAIGLNFYPQSSRCVEIAQARAVRGVLPPFVSAVAVFVDPQADEVRRVVDAVQPEMLQFHGDEPAQFCASFGLPYIKACRVRAGVDLLEFLRPYASAAGWLFDAYVEGYGGGGQAFDWTLMPTQLARPVILSGGLTPDNVGEAVRRVKPWAVDVSSGVESAKGIKDAERVRRFIQEVRRADS
jgi:phosphoribosylanthranilate isomerase